MATQLKRYMIQAGDTIHQVARRELGQADQWWILVRLNNLAYPYLDGRGPSTTPRVLGLGDTLLIPGNVRDPAIREASVETTGPIDQYAILLGKDLTLGEAGELGVSKSSGDWKIQAGLPNLLQALTHRLQTRKGELAYHPEYGSNIEQYIGQPHDALMQAALRHEIRQTLLGDPRISAVQNVRIREDFDHVAVTVQATIIGQQDSVPLNLVLERQAV